MESSASYIAIEAMIQQGWLTLNCVELDKFLVTFERKHLITPSEHKALLELAKKLSTKKPPARDESS